MANCLITVSGTSGEVLIQYKVSGVPNSITTGIGTFSIDDSITNVTYTTLYGDAIATSSCLTITHLIFICYKISWKDIKADGYVFDSIILSNDQSFTLTSSGFPDNGLALAASINNLNVDDIKCTFYKITYPVPLLFNSFPEYSYILQTIGEIPPQLKIKSADGTHSIYLKGVANSCSPSGYTPINICNPEISE